MSKLLMVGVGYLRVSPKFLPLHKDSIPQISSPPNTYSTAFVAVSPHSSSGPPSLFHNH